MVHAHDDQIVDMYLNDVPIVDIMKTVGVARGTVYAALRRRHIQPNRIGEEILHGVAVGEHPINPKMYASTDSGFSAPLGWTRLLSRFLLASGSEVLNLGLKTLHSQSKFVHLLAQFVSLIPAVLERLVYGLADLTPLGGQQLPFLYDTFGGSLLTVPPEQKP